MSRQTIGGFLQTLRKANGYTQQQVADILGVSNKTISAWETDKAYPDLMTIPAIADLYGVTADEILRGERAAKTEGAPLSPSKKTERVALKNRLAEFSYQSFMLLIMFCGGVVLIVAGMFVPYDWGIILLALGVFMLAALFIYRTVIYKKARGFADASDGEQNETRIIYLLNIRAAERRCRNIEAIIFFAAGMVLLIDALASLDSVVISGVYWFSVILIFICAAVLAIYCRKTLHADVALHGDDRQKSAATGNNKLLKKCLIFSGVFLAAAAACIIAMTLVSGELTLMILTYVAFFCAVLVLIAAIIYLRRRKKISFAAL